MSVRDIRPVVKPCGHGRRLLRAGMGMALAALFLPVPPGAAERSYSVQVDGKPVVFSSIGPVDVSGRVLVPLRGVLERTGATVRWSPEERKVFAQRGASTVELTVGERTAKVNGRPSSLDVPAMMMRGTTMVPLRFLVEALGASVQEAGGQIRIATRKPAAPATPVATRSTARPPVPSPARTPTPAAPTPPAVAAAARQTLDGTVERVDAGATPPRIAVRVDGESAEFPLATTAVVLAREGGELGSARESSLAEVFPGDQVKAKLDSTGKITILVALFDQVEGTVAGVDGQTLDLGGAGKVDVAEAARVVLPSGAVGTRADLIGGEGVRVRLKPGTREATLVTVTKASDRPPAPIAAVAPTEEETKRIATAPGETETPPTTPGAGETETPAPTPAAPGAGEMTPPVLPAVPGVGGENPPAEEGVPAAPPQATPPAGAETAAPVDLLEVASFIHDANTPLRAGALLAVTLEGEPGAEATFDVGKVAPGLAMQEQKPGLYVGTYTIPDGLNERISIFGRLKREGKASPLVQAGVPVIIDSVAPTASDFAPAKGRTVQEAQPTIYAVFEDATGSGVDSDQVKISVAGEDVTAQATRSPRFITYRPAHPLANGPVTIRLAMKDRAGNAAEVEWQFTVDAPEVPIASLAHTAARPVDVGQSFTVTLSGKPRGAASFDIGTLKVGIPMEETSPGIYQGRYSAEKGDMIFDARIIGHLVTEAGEKHSRECSEPISLVTLPPRAPTIVAPVEGEAVEPALVVTGRAQPGVTVRVQVTRMVRKLGLWSDKDIVAAQEVKVDKDGIFATSKMQIPTAHGQGKDLTVQAVAVDPAGHSSEVVSVKVKLP